MLFFKIAYSHYKTTYVVFSLYEDSMLYYRFNDNTEIILVSQMIIDYWWRTIYVQIIFNKLFYYHDRVNR